MTAAVVVQAEPDAPAAAERHSGALVLWPGVVVSGRGFSRIMIEAAPPDGSPGATWLKELIAAHLLPGGAVEWPPIEPKRHASLWEGRHCAACGWPVVFACCNDGMAEAEPYAGNDWWAYCANKTCGNHGGEDVWQGDPAWVKRGV